MIWQSLVEGGYFHPIFGFWYSNQGFTLFIIVGVVALFLLSLVMPQVIKRGLTHNAPRKIHDNARFYKLQISWRTLRRLASKRVTVKTIIFTHYEFIIIFVLYIIYGFYFKQLLTNPNLLVTSPTLEIGHAIQRLSTTDFETLLSFFQRFSILGGFLIIAMVAVTIRIFILLLNEGVTDDL